MSGVKSSQVAGMDKTKITRKPSKTGKHGHEKRKSTKEAGKSSQRSEREGFYQSKGGKDNSSGLVHNGREKDVILIGKVKQRITRGLEKAQEKWEFALDSLS
ncbi:hypothetical protein Tco_1526251 [Tanacetum coccineum]